MNTTEAEDPTASVELTWIASSSAGGEETTTSTSAPVLQLGKHVPESTFKTKSFSQVLQLKNCFSQTVEVSSQSPAKASLTQNTNTASRTTPASFASGQ